MTFINVEGLDSLAAFVMMSGDNDVTEMAKRMATRPTAAGRVSFGTMQIKRRIQALVHWVKDYDKRGLVPEPDMWTAGDTMMEAMERKKAEQNYGEIDVDIIDPGKCQTNHGWDNWQIAFVNKLNATMGAANVPIDYVVCPDVDEDNFFFFDDEEERRYQMPLGEGQNFKHDNKLVYKILKAACLDTDVWPWISKTDGDGRLAWLKLVGHYDGYGELNKRVERANKMEILRLHYKDEKVFPYEKYVTKLKENFRVLEKDDNNEQMTGLRQVHTILHGMNTIDVGVEAAKTTVFHSMRNSFDKAVEFMSAYISNRHAGAQANYANRHGGDGRGRRYVSATGSDDARGGHGRTGGGRSGQRGGRGNGRGRGRGRGNPRRTYANNVDIIDPHRNYTSTEWGKLGTMRNYVLQL